MSYWPGPIFCGTALCSEIYLKHICSFVITDASLPVCRYLNMIGRSRLNSHSSDFKAEQDPGFPNTSCHACRLGNLHSKQVKNSLNLQVK